MTETNALTAPPEARRKSRRGMLVCVGLFVLGGAVLWGLFLAPRNRPPAAPAVPWGTPVRPLRFVTVDLGGVPLAEGGDLVADLRKLDPDFVLVQNARFNDVLPLAEGLGMAKSFHPRLFQRPDPKAKDAPGDAILSIHALYEARPVAVLPDPDIREGRGVRAVAVVDRVKFVVVSGVGATDQSRKALEADLRREGPPPTVVGTGQIRPANGDGVYSGYLLQVMVAQQRAGRGEVSPVGGIYADASWTQAPGDFTTPIAGRHLSLYVELKASGTAGAGAANGKSSP